MLYIPNEGIGAEIMPVGPGNALMGGPHLAKIAFILQFQAERAIRESACIGPELSVDNFPVAV